MIQRTLGEIDLADFTPPQAAVIRELMLTNSSAPIPLWVIARNTRQTVREVKGCVEILRKRRQPVCSRRGKPAGYWWGRSASDLEETARVLIKQAVSMIISARNVAPDRTIREMLGQSTISDLLETR